MKAAVRIFAVLFLMACSGKPFAVKPQAQSQAVRSHTVYIVSHGWHTGLIMAASDVNQGVPELKNRFGEVAFYELGWGDKGFYQSQQITTGLTLQAMFWSEGAVMHVVAVPDSPAHYFSGEDLLETCISDNELAALNVFVASSFARDAAGHVMRLRAGIYGDSEFYAGEGRYHLLSTCNKWTAKALGSAGLDISPVFKLTSGSVMKYLAAHSQACAKTKISFQGARLL